MSLFKGLVRVRQENETLTNRIGAGLAVRGRSNRYFIDDHAVSLSMGKCQLWFPIVARKQIVIVGNHSRREVLNVVAGAFVSVNIQRQVLRTLVRLFLAILVVFRRFVHRLNGEETEVVCLDIR